MLENDGRTAKKILIDFEPFRSINTSLYFCDNKFHVEDLAELLDTDPPFGFIIVLVIISFIIFSILSFIWVVISSIPLSP